VGSGLTATSAGRGALVDVVNGTGARGGHDAGYTATVSGGGGGSSYVTPAATQVFAVQGGADQRGNGYLIISW
jgi:hypothetical protein